MKANIPPFTVGQKVIYITGKVLPKDSTHIVKGLVKNSCGCWHVDIGLKEHYGLKFCNTHGISHLFQSGGSRWFNSTSFRPLQEQTAPLLTFEKIKETEKEEILIMN